MKFTWLYKISTNQNIILCYILCFLYDKNKIKLIKHVICFVILYWDYIENHFHSHKLDLNLLFYISVKATHLSTVLIQHLKIGYRIGVMLHDFWVVVIIVLDFVIFFNIIWFTKFPNLTFESVIFLCHFFLTFL